MQRIGVLTGDIVASSRVPPRQRKAFVIKLERVVRGRPFPNLARVAGIMATQIFRGDAFQLAFDHPERGLELALSLFSALKQQHPEAGSPIEARLGLGIGALRFKGPKTKLGTWSGDAFEHAARSLEALDAPPERRIGFTTPWPELDAEFKVVGGFLDHLMRRWSREQAEAILGTLEGKTQQVIAAEVGVGQSAISQRLNAAGWWPVKDACVRFRERVVLFSSD